MELIGIIIGVVIVLFTSWASLWYKIGRLTTKVDQCNETTKELQKQVEALITTRLYHCDGGEGK